MKNNTINILIATFLILVAASARIINAEMHLYNFAPMAALGLFSGAVIKEKRSALILAIGAQLLADVYFQLFTNTPGFYGISQLFTYAALLTVTFAGISIKKVNAQNVLVYSFVASTIFFIISNVGVWVSGLWGTGAQALVKTFVMAVPFFKNAIIGDMAGSVLLFGSFYLIQAAFTNKLQKARI